LSVTRSIFRHRTIITIDVPCMPLHVVQSTGSLERKQPIACKESGEFACDIEIRHVFDKYPITVLMNEELCSTSCFCLSVCPSVRPSASAKQLCARVYCPCFRQHLLKTEMWRSPISGNIYITLYNIWLSVCSRTSTYLGLLKFPAL
jgi:hypothetical protein